MSFVFIMIMQAFGPLVSPLALCFLFLVIDRVLLVEGAHLGAIHLDDLPDVPPGAPLVEGDPDLGPDLDIDTVLPGEGIALLVIGGPRVPSPRGRPQGEGIQQTVGGH